MKPLQFPRSVASLAALLVLLASAAKAQTFSIDFQAGVLTDRFGDPLSDGRLVLLVADTGNDGFGPLLSGRALHTGSFLNSDDQILFGTSIDSDSFGAGSIVGSATGLKFSDFPSLTVGRSLALIWFSSATSESLSGGEEYGLFTGGLTPLAGNPWAVPAQGALIELSFLTDAVDEGVYSSLLGQTSHTVSAIPEPSTYAVLLGLAVLGFAAYRRRSRSG